MYTIIETKAPMYIAFEIKISDVHCFGNQNSDGQYYGNQNSYTMLWSKGSDVHCYGNQSFSVHCCVSKDHNMHIAIETKVFDAHSYRKEQSVHIYTKAPMYTVLETKTSMYIAM
jgi:hypothetical protein